MQKYSPISDDTPNMREDSEHGSFYWCEDVDKRIEVLERALKSAGVALSQFIKHADGDVGIGKQAISEVDRALSL
jgi:hypothetical protein